jgi:hypothetical protein
VIKGLARISYKTGSVGKKNRTYLKVTDFQGMEMEQYAILLGFWNNPVEHLERWFLSLRSCYVWMVGRFTYFKWCGLKIQGFIVPTTNPRMEKWYRDVLFTSLRMEISVRNAS